MTSMRTTVWRPAEFVGLRPGWLVAQGFLAGDRRHRCDRRYDTLPRLDGQARDARR